MAAEGVTAILVGRGLAALREVAAELDEAGGASRVIIADLCADADVEPLQCEAGQVDTLANNAAAEESWGPIVTADIGSWRTVVDVNVFAPVHLIKAFCTWYG